MLVPAGGSVTRGCVSAQDSAAAEVECRRHDPFDQRIADADEFYAALIPPDTPDAARLIARQAYAGLLWTKQFYHYSVHDWLEGDPAQPAAARRRAARAATPTGATSITATSFRCPTTGSIRGTPPGTWRST